MAEQDEKNDTDMIAQANKAAERLEKANADNRELVAKLEAIETRKILGGKAAAGEPPAQPAPETPAEYAKRMMRGGV